MEPPLWAGLIASYQGADLLDAEVWNLTLEQTEKVIRTGAAFSPTYSYGGHQDVLIVVMGNNPSVSSTPKMPVAEALADRVSDLNVSLTGLHPVAAGSNYPVIKKPFEGTPIMDWHRLKLPMKSYRAHNWHCLDGTSRSPYASIYTSLGCPYDCYYCNIHTLYGGRGVQLRPIGDILYEVMVLDSLYHIRNIKIWDEMFALNEDRAVEICSALERFDLNIWAYARLDTVTERMLKAMKRGGINWLAYGFESVTDPKFSDRAEDVIRMTREAGINIIANFMFGLPGTTQEDDEASVEFAKEHLFEWVNFYDAKPYPGSRWYADLEHEAANWEDFSQFKDITPFRQRAFQDYFTKPAYLMMVEGKFGGQAVKQVEAMLNWRIK
ncbi:hypothetical protein LCGC14_2130990 [marine sediment metagenome]|uniref:Radical SAM core domain-containing protein n=1 Tax=marine sediment metagenome TaxID=412755 RepID=A0A0F9ENM2_9ZZZZ